MSNLIVKSNQLVTYQLEVQREISTHHHSDIELIYMLKGLLKLTIDNEEFEVSENDIIIINSNCKHSFEADQEVFYIILHFNYSNILGLLNANKISFLCNSCIEEKNEYTALRVLLSKILKDIYENSNDLERNINYYHLVEYLMKYFVFSFSKAEESSKVNHDRNYEIENFIQANYYKNISLKQLSDFLFLSSPYVSKYFKEQFGMNFYKYLNNVRLTHALNDLITLDHSITSIALKNGFPNVSAFNKLFKEEYHTTPHHYRLNYIEYSKRTFLKGNQNNLRERLKNILENPARTELHSQNTSLLSVSSDTRTPFLKYWTKVLNLNEVAILRSFNLQEQLKTLKDDLGFEYGRIWNIFSDEMKIVEASTGRNTNFFNLERIFDSLMELKIKPYLVFDPVIDFENLNINDSLSDSEKISQFISFFQSLISHLINRYGLKQVQEWCFEIIYRPNAEKEASSFFIQFFKQVQHTLYVISPQFKVGGAGLPLHVRVEDLTSFLTEWFKEAGIPDFLTFQSETHPYEEVEDEIKIRQLLDSRYIQNKVTTIKEVIKDIGYELDNIQISNWNCIYSDLNILNDSCYKAAQVMKNVIDCYGLLHALGYWYALDSLSELADTPSLLYGSPGLLSKQGLKKTSYYAYAFLNVGESKYYLGKDSYSLITSNGTDNFFIVNHNCGAINYKYYLDQFVSNDQTVYTEVCDEEIIRTLCYRILNVKNGVYKIKIRSVNESYGNIQREWIKLNQGKDLSKSEIDYLKQISVPRMTIFQVRVKDGILDLETKLNRNEIQSIRITYQY